MTRLKAFILTTQMPTCATIWFILVFKSLFPRETSDNSVLNERGAFDSAKNHKRQRRKRQSVTAKRAKSQTPKFVQVTLGQVRLS